jgi:hypothetical protein
VKEGEQLMVNYGPFDNFTYLFRYGFIPEDNPYAMCYCFPEYFEDYSDVTNLFRVADKTTITELPNRDGHSMYSIKKAIRVKQGVKDLTILPVSKNLPLLYWEQVYRAYLLRIVDMEELGIEDIADCIDLDYTKQLTVKNEMNMCLFLLKAAGFHYRCIPDDAKGTFPEGVTIEQEELDTFWTVKTYYNDKFDKLSLEN